MSQERIRARLAKAYKAGYSIEWLQPRLIAKVCAAQYGRVIKPIPRFVKTSPLVAAAAVLDAKPVPMTDRMIWPEGWSA